MKFDLSIITRTSFPIKANCRLCKRMYRKLNELKINRHNNAKKFQFFIFKQNKKDFRKEINKIFQLKIKK